MDSQISTRNKKARLAGLLYLLLVICGLAYLVYVPSQIVDWDNATRTLENLERKEMLFKLGIVAAICSFIIFILLPLALYRLLKEVDKNAALLMALLAILSVPISFVNILNKSTILSLLETPEPQKGNDLAYQVMFYLEQYSNGTELLQIFWGLWLLPFGYLVYRSVFLPKLLGILLMLGCFGYLITFFGGFLYPGFSKTVFSTIVALPASIGEIGTCLWLLIMGTNTVKFAKK